MPVPVSENIDLNVLSVLSGISTATGYSTNPTAERFKKNGNRPDHLKVIQCVGSDQAAADDDTPLQAQAWLRPYELLIYVFESSDVTGASYDQMCNLARADVEKALMQDTTRGGYAQNTFIRDPLLFHDANDASGVMVRFDVLYRTQFDDPYTAR